MKTKQIISSTTCLFFTVVYLNAYAQTIYSLGLQLNPILSITTGNANGTLTSSKYKLFDVGIGSGLELNCVINKHIIIMPVFKYYHTSQKIINKDFKNYLSDESFVYQKLTYENKDLGLLTKIYFTKKSLLTFGAVYSLATNNVLKWRYRYRNIENLSAIGYRFNINEIGTKNNMFKICVGVRNDLTIKKIGRFEYGLLCFIPTKSMPENRYEQTLITTTGQINDYSNFSSKQISTEISLIYKLINLDKNFKREFRKSRNDGK